MLKYRVSGRSPGHDVTPNKVMAHNEFLQRIAKTLYYGPSPAVCSSRPLADYAAEIFSEAHKGYSLNRLNFVTVANLRLNPCSLILAIIYLERLKETNPCYLKKISPSELFIVSLMVSTKFYCGYDEEIYIKDWADYGDVDVITLMRMELEFLSALNWDIYVSSEKFFERLCEIEHTLAERQGLKRGWLTYTELAQLMPSISLAHYLIKSSLALALGYAASMITLAGAIYLAASLPGTNVTTTQSTKPAAPLTPSPSGMSTMHHQHDARGRHSINDNMTSDPVDQEDTTEDEIIESCHVLRDCSCGEPQRDDDDDATSIPANVIAGAVTTFQFVNTSSLNAYYNTRMTDDQPPYLRHNYTLDELVEEQLRRGLEQAATKHYSLKFLWYKF